MVNVLLFYKTSWEVRSGATADTVRRTSETVCRREPASSSLTVALHELGLLPTTVTLTRLATAVAPSAAAHRRKP